MEKELEIHQKPPQVDGKQTIPLSRKLCIGRGRNALGWASTDEARPPKYGSPSTVQIRPRSERFERKGSSNSAYSMQ